MLSTVWGYKLSPEKDIVNWWLNRRGFFVINSIPTGKNRVIDILAIKSGVDKKIQHIEINCSVSQASNLTLDNSSVKGSVEKYIAKKFDDKSIVNTINRSIEEYIGEEAGYEKVLVLGAMAKVSREETIEELRKKGIVVYKFEEIMLDVTRHLDKQNYMNPTIRTLQITKHLLLSNPEKLALLLDKRAKNDVLNQNTREEFIRHLLRQDEVKRILQKESSEKLLIDILKDSTLIRPDKLAKALKEEIYTLRRDKKFSRIISGDHEEKIEILEKLQKPLEYFLRKED